MNGRFDGKVALVTGGGSGIGAAIVRSFVSEGGRAMVVDLAEWDRVDASVRALGPDVVHMSADVSMEVDVAAAVERTLAAFGQLDVCCNNAGIRGHAGPIAEVSLDDFDRVLAVLLRGVVLGTKYAARAMIRRGAGGAIVNTASIAGFCGGLAGHDYTTAKHAVIGFTRSTAAELARHGIRVNAVAPGPIPTAMAAVAATGGVDGMAAATEFIARQSPLGRAPTAEDVAQAVLYLASDAGGYVNGHTIVVDGGLLSGAPPPLQLDVFEPVRRE